MLRVTVWAVRKWRSDGKIAFVRINNTVLFEHDEVLRFIKEHTHPRTWPNTRQPVGPMAEGEPTLIEDGMSEEQIDNIIAQTG